MRPTKPSTIEYVHRASDDDAPFRRATAALFGFLWRWVLPLPAFLLAWFILRVRPQQLVVGEAVMVGLLFALARMAHIGALRGAWSRLGRKLRRCLPHGAERPDARIVELKVTGRIPNSASGHVADDGFLRLGSKALVYEGINVSLKLNFRDIDHVVEQSPGWRGLWMVGSGVGLIPSNLDGIDRLDIIDCTPPPWPFGRRPASIAEDLERAGVRRTSVDRPRWRRTARAISTIARAALAMLLIGVAVVGRWPFADDGGPGPPLIVAKTTGPNARTVVTATLSGALEPQMNVVWCASFELAWKELERLNGGPVAVHDAEGSARALNAESESLPALPDGTTYAAAGKTQDGIVDAIRREMSARFPERSIPDFSEAAPDGFVMFGYVEAHVPFPQPYVDAEGAVTFRASGGKETRIRTFGAEHGDGRYDLRKQAHVLYRGGGSGAGAQEFVIDLCSECETNQLLVAMIEPASTLAGTIDAMEQRIAKGGSARGDPLGATDTVLVPMLHFDLEHHFRALEGRTIDGGLLSGQRMDVAAQTVYFRLDRSGAELRSAALGFTKSMPDEYIVNRPFLVLLRKRGELRPYFAAWIANDALLTPWGP